MAKSTQTQLSEEYDIIGTVGHGSMSSVHRAIRCKDRKEVALKKTRTDDEEVIRVTQAEFELLRELDHPHIVHALDLIVMPGTTVLVLSFFDGMDLLQTVHSAPGGHLIEAETRGLCIQLAQAVEYLHCHGVAHRDIKPENIVVSRDLSNLQLVDFNVACHTAAGEEPLTPTGTLLYSAPEVILGSSPCESSDVWSVGLCLYLMLSGRLPQGRDRCRGRSSMRTAAERPVIIDGNIWDHVSDECKDVLRACVADVCGRADMSTILGHRWLQSAATPQTGYNSETDALPGCRFCRTDTDSDSTTCPEEAALPNTMESYDDYEMIETPTLDDLMHQRRSEKVLSGEMHQDIASYASI